MQSILITGGAGFIGSRLSLKLAKFGYEVTVMDNLSPQIHGSKPAQSSLYGTIAGKVRFIKGDVRNMKDCLKALKNMDYIYHFAAETGTGQSMYEIARYSDVNIQGTANLLQAIIDSKTKIQKIILSSSRAVYGEGSYKCSTCKVVTPSSRKKEDMEKAIWNMFCPKCHKPVKPIPTKESANVDPQSIYAVTKYAQEMLIRNFCSAYKIPFVIFRYQNVYGAGQSLKNPYTGVLSAFTTRILNGHIPDIFEDGTEARDFIHVDDITKVNVKAIQTYACDQQVINVGSGKSTPIIDAAILLSKALNSHRKPTISGIFRVGDIYNCYADISKAEKYFNFKPSVSISKGINEFAKWAMRQNKEKDLSEAAMKELASKGLSC